MKTGSGSAAAAVLCIGPERWLRAQAIGRLKAQCLAPAFEDVDFTRFSEDPLPTQEILEALTTSPFGSPRRLVLVEGIEELKEESLPWLPQYLARSHPQALLVVCAQRMGRSGAAFLSHKKPRDAGHPSTEAYKRPPLVEWISCQPLKPQELDQWIAGQFQGLGKRIEPEAQALLVRRLGSNLEALSLAIESLSLFTGSAAALTKQDVETLIAPSLRETAFDILEGAAAGRPETAVSMLRQGLQEGRLTVEQFMGALGWMYRAAWRAKASPRGARVSPGLARLARQPYLRLKSALEEALEADARLKYGYPAPEFLADGLLLKLGS